MKYQGKIVEYMTMVNDFFRDLNELIPDKTTTGLSIFKRLKLLYYIKIKYPIMRWFIKKFIFNYMKDAINKPVIFMDFVTESLVILESYVSGHSKFNTINEFIDNQYKMIEQKPSVSIVLDKVNDVTIKTCKIIIHRADYNINKLVHIDLAIDFVNYKWEVEATIYSDVEGEHIEKLKTFNILPTGELYNYLYKIDSKLLDEDTMYFKGISLSVMGSLTYLLSSILSYEFVLLKSK